MNGLGYGSAGRNAHDEKEDDGPQVAEVGPKVAEFAARQGQSQFSEKLSKRQRLEVLQHRKLRSFCCVSRQSQSQCSEESSQRQRLEVLQGCKPLQSGSFVVFEFIHCITVYLDEFIHCITVFLD